MLGANLLIYQMNKDLSPSLFARQSILEEDLNKEEIQLIQSYLSEINNVKMDNHKVTEIIPNDPKLWFPRIFIIFLEFIDKLTNTSSRLSEEKKNY